MKQAGTTVPILLLLACGAENQREISHRLRSHVPQQCDLQHCARAVEASLKPSITADIELDRQDGWHSAPTVTLSANREHTRAKPSGGESNGDDVRCYALCRH